MRDGCVRMHDRWSPTRTMVPPAQRGDAGSVTYSLVSATALGFDLVRLSAGEQVAAVVLAALKSDRDDLVRLAEHHPGPDRHTRWEHVRAAGAAERAQAALALAVPAFDLALAGEVAASNAVLHRLERALVGDLDGLERLVRYDALERTWIGSE